LLDERKSLYSSTYVCTMLPVHYAQTRLVRRAWFHVWFLFCGHSCL